MCQALAAPLLLLAASRIFLCGTPHASAQQLRDDSAADSSTAPLSCAGHCQTGPAGTLSGPQVKSWAASATAAQAASEASAPPPCGCDPPCLTREDCCPDACAVCGIG